MKRPHLAFTIAGALIGTSVAMSFSAACESGADSSHDSGTASGAGAQTPSSGSTGGFEAPDISGQWVSACFPQGDGTFAALDFDIAADTWALDYRVHGDDTCGFALVTIHIAGPYEITAASGAVEGAFEARFGFDVKTITPHADPLVEALEDAGCGEGAWAVDGTQSVLQDGCAAFGQYPVTECPADFDLVALGAEGLRFGTRPADNNMCTQERRPNELSALVLAAIDDAG